jgi:H/ACA ribonucleoprotein complex non-core subunit NAF1
MSSFTTFKVPSVLPQDLLLIQDLVKQEETFTQTPLPPTNVSRDDLDCIESSGGEEAGSEEEVEANLLTNDNEVDKPQTLYVNFDTFE